MTDHDDSYRTASEQQLAIKDKRNIDLAVGDTVLKLSDLLYNRGLTVNFITTSKLWRNGIGVYILDGRSAELFFNKTSFVYSVNVRDQFILR